MKKKSPKNGNVLAGQPPRSRRMVCRVSEEEAQIIDRYLARHKVTNKGRWLRELVLGTIYRTIEQDYPTLFDEHEMRR